MGISPEISDFMEAKFHDLRRYPEKGIPNGNIPGDISKKGTQKGISTWMELKGEAKCRRSRRYREKGNLFRDIPGDMGKKLPQMEISRDIPQKLSLLASVHVDIVKRGSKIPISLEISEKNFLKSRHPRGYREKWKQKSTSLRDGSFISNELRQSMWEKVASTSNQ